MKIFKYISILICILCIRGNLLGGSVGFGTNTGNYNPYAGYSIGSQATFVGETIGMQAGVVGLNALAQKAFKWGNSFNKKRKQHPQGEFGLYPHSYTQPGTLARYRKVGGVVRSSNLASAANLSPEFVEENKKIGALCAKWKQVNIERFLVELKEENGYEKTYPELIQEAGELEKHRREIKMLLNNPHDPGVEDQLKHISHEAYMTASKIDLIILKMVTQEIDANKDAIEKGSIPEKKSPQEPPITTGYFPDLDEDDDDGYSTSNNAQKTVSHSSNFNKEWLKERQTYLEQAVLIWYNRFRKKEQGNIYEISWDQSDPFLKQGYNAWQEAIETEAFIKSQLARY